MSVLPVAERHLSRGVYVCRSSTNRSIQRAVKRIVFWLAQVSFGLLGRKCTEKRSAVGLAALGRSGAEAHLGSHGWRLCGQRPDRGGGALAVAPAAAEREKHRNLILCECGFELRQCLF